MATKINPKLAGIGLLLILILAAGIFLRFEDLGRQSYWMDEGYTVNAIMSAERNGTRNFSSILDSGQTYSCPLYCYPTRWLASIFGDNAFSYRLLAAIFGTLMIGLAFVLAKKLFSRNVAFVASAVFALSYWQIAWSREARWYTEFEFFFWLSILSAELAAHALSVAPAKTVVQRSTETETGGNDKINKLRAICFALFAVISAALATITTNLGFLIFPMIAIIVIARWGRGPSSPREAISGSGHIKRFWIPVAAGMAILAILALALIVRLQGWGFFKAALAMELHYSLPYYLNWLLRNYWLFIIFAIYGFFAAEKEARRPYYVLILPIAVYLLCLGFLTNIVQYRYLFAPAAGLMIAGTAGALTAMANIKKWAVSKPFLRLKDGRVSYGIVGAIFITIFFLSGQGILLPKDFYALESDPPSAQSRPYWGYTPQSNFNAAYGYVREHYHPGDIIISSHPAFTKIFLDQAGYWIPYDLNGFGNKFAIVKNGRENYVGAQVVGTTEELRGLVERAHGYVIFDAYSTDRRIEPETIAYIREYLHLVFSDSTNPYSQIWVYQF